MTDWDGTLTRAEEHLLGLLTGYSQLDNPFENVITEAIRYASDDTIVEWFDDPECSLAALSRLATKAQMIVYDHSDGPEGDGQAKALRRHWYSWYKVDFAQPISVALGEDLNDTKWGTRWAGRLSQTYAGFVDDYLCTYKDLWVDDGSRMFQMNYDTLFKGCHILLCVEKDSLFPDFKAVSQAIGAACLYSGKGKSSKAAIEKIMREVFYWSEHWNPFDYNHPLYVLHISDYDYDGEEVIGPTFAEQVRRYTTNVVECRVGVDPQQLIDAGYAIQEKWYVTKLTNKAYQVWAAAKALFYNPNDYRSTWGNVQRGYSEDIPEAIPHGLEVESMKAHQYQREVVKSLLQVLPYDTIITGLRHKCKPDLQYAVEEIRNWLAQHNPKYLELQAEIDRLKAVRDDFLADIECALTEVAEREAESDRIIYLGDTPPPDDFVDHGGAARGYCQAWMPFSQRARTHELKCILEEGYEGDEFADVEIVW